MTRKNGLLWLLILATLLALVTQLPGIRSEYLAVATLFGFLTGIAIYFGILLTQGEISTAFMLGILGTLLLPAEAMPTLTWGIFCGGFSASIARGLWRRRRPRYHRTAHLSRNIVTVSSRVTLGFVTANIAYQWLGGRQPWTQPTIADVIPILGFGLVYLIIFLGIFLLAIYLDGRPVARALSENRHLLALTLTVPPFIAILAAPHIESTIILLIVFLPVTVGLYGYGRSRFDLRWQQRQLQALAKISQAMRANQDLRGLLQTVYAELEGLIHIDHFKAVLIEANGRQWHLPLVVQNRELRTDHPLVDPRPGSPIAHILETQSSLLLTHNAAAMAQQRGLQAPDAAVSAWLGVPLLVGDRTLGALVIGSADSNQRFGAEEQHVLGIIAAATSAALDNTQLYKQQAERVVQLGNVNAVLALLTETLSPDEVLDTIISSASAISEATAVAVYRSQDTAFTLVRCAGLSDDFAVNPLLVIQPQAGPENIDQPIVVTNVADDQRVDHLRRMLRHENKAAWIELPLMVSAQPVGALLLYYDAPHAFTSEQIQLLRTFANQAAQAIVNADLYAGTYRALENRIEQLSTLANLGRDLMATMNPAIIAELLLKYAQAATNAPVGAILLRDNDRDGVRLAVEHGYPAGTFTNPAVLEQGLTGQVLATSEPVWSGQVQDVPNYLSLMPTTQSQLSVPIIWQGTSLGVMTLESDQLDHFDAEQVDFISQLTNQVVFAVENARLFHDAAEGRDRVQTILNTMSEGLILLDRHGHIALANPHVSLLGLNHQELVGRDIQALLDQPNLEFAERLGFQSDNDLLRLIKGQPVLPVGIFGYTLASDKAPVYIQREIIPIQAEATDVNGILLVFRDETERHKLDRAREEFSQLIIHDLRSPLTAVTSSVELLSEIVPPENEYSALVARTADSSRRAIRRLLNRVDSLLDVSRMKSGQMSLQLEVAQLDALVANVQAELEPLAQQFEISIVAKLPSPAPDLMIDVEKVERILLNLLDNALKFSPRESEVLVTAQRDQNGNQSQLQVAIVDHGPGVPEAERESIFDRFVQIQQQAGHHRRGSGLGLNFCKLAVEAHGGHIWIEENPTGGTMMNFTLPIHGAADQTEVEV